ncbi:hypothetical protein GCM10022224_083910 [Nonomuraea antimicrobica]|uniref:Uncharacterized protein n=1 Tax=Nonomuraea antimicrobica TaxID=561173 RepID=A0ABP7DII1_9ACTN
MACCLVRLGPTCPGGAAGTLVSQAAVAEAMRADAAAIMPTGAGQPRRIKALAQAARAGRARGQERFPSSVVSGALWSSRMDRR